MPEHADFLHFFHRSEAELRVFIRSLVRDPHAASDLFQEVSRTLWQKFEDYDLERPFASWARGIASLKALEARRRDARFPITFPPETVAALCEAFDEEEPAREEHQAALRECLAALPAASRELLRRRYEQAEPCAALAATARTSLKAMHQTLCRLRKALHTCITRRLSRNPESETALTAVRHE
jgi:RNA polymerase sigma-70 factor (ECF subfamily)